MHQIFIMRKIIFQKKKKNKLKTREYVKIVIDTLSSIKNIILKKLI